MSQRQGNCPNCGGAIQFRWSSAVQTICPFCKSILVRDDLTLENVGTVADLPPDPSPIQLMTSGTFKNKNFEVIGRLVYEYEQGGWNEWHIVFSDGVSGWLSDAQLQYAVSFLVPNQTLPHLDQVSRGENFHLANIDFEVTTVTTANYKGMEGELPFAYFGKKSMLFADLRNTTRSFATLDYSEPEAPLLFVGETVPYEALQLRNVRQFEGWV